MRKEILLILFIFLITVIGVSYPTTIVEGKEYSKEMKHFHYIYYQEKEPINEINNILKDHYNKILNKYDVKLNDKIKLIIYPDIKTFHEEANVINRSSGIVGKASGSYKISIVSPLNPGKVHNYDSILKITVHEFVHISTNKINRNVPIWLNEGVSLYEAGQINKRTVKKLINANKIPTIEQLNNNFYKNYGYAISGTYVQYIIDRYGHEKLAKLIKSPNKLENILGASEELFYNNFKGYLHKEYN